MSDLNHVSSFPSFPNPAKAYYQTLGTDSFVVSYHNVPFWYNGTPDHMGDNTFQVIFDLSDTSITFQYLAMDDTVYSYSSGCSHNSIVGFENETGTDGLTILDDGQEPEDSLAIRIECPNCLFTSNISEIEKQNIIYPNPVSDILYINIGNTVIIEIYNSNAQLVYKKENVNSCSLHELSKGIYFIRIIDNDRSWMEKIIKE